MAKPRYIICSEGRLVDPGTGLLTHVNVMERFVVQRERAQPAADGTKLIVPDVPISTLILTAVWTREAGDLDTDEFQFETILHQPDGRTQTIQSGEFRFEKRHFRIDSGFVFTTRTQFKQSGEIVLESRIKKRGTDNWLSQTFSMDLELVQSDQPEPMPEITGNAANH